MKASKSQAKTHLRTKTPKQSTQPRAAVPYERLHQRRIEKGRFIEFPVIKGRILEKVEFFTAADFHSLTLYFQDKTSLTLVIEPSFLMAANFADRSSNEQRILKRWQPIRSATEK